MRRLRHTSTQQVASCATRIHGTPTIRTLHSTSTMTFVPVLLLLFLVGGVGGFSSTSAAARPLARQGTCIGWDSPLGDGGVRMRASGTGPHFVDGAEPSGLSNPAPPSMLPPDTDIPPSSREAPLVDVRPFEAFEAGHVVGSTSIPLTELQERSYELPAPFEAPLRLCCSTPQDLNAAHGLLSGLGWKVLPSFTVDLAEAPTPADEAPCWWRGVEWVAGGDSTACWRPSSFLESCVSEIMPGLGSRLAASAHGGLVEEGSRRRVALDLGCGSGRDAVFIAKALGPDWTVVGIDNHGAALERAHRLAQVEGVASRTQWLRLNLRKPATMEGLSHDFGADLVHGCRFLDRRLITLARDSLVNPGGIFIWSTFMEGEKNLAPPFRPSRRLFPGELKHLFTDPNCPLAYDVLRDEVGVLNTRQKDVPASFFAARRCHQSGQKQ